MASVRTMGDVLATMDGQQKIVINVWRQVGFCDNTYFNPDNSIYNRVIAQALDNLPLVPWQSALCVLLFTAFLSLSSSSSADGRLAVLSSTLDLRQRQRK